MKNCRQCKQDKPFTEFYKSNSNNDGLHSYCKKCVIWNSKQRLENTREWRKNNREKIREYERQYRLDNPDYVDRRNARVSNWKKDNPQRVKAHVQNRRALKFNQGGSIPDNYIEILEARDTHCIYCNLHIATYGYHIDHIVPLSRGGLHSFDNLRLICESCNLKKHNKLETEFIPHRR